MRRIRDVDTKWNTTFRYRAEEKQTKEEQLNWLADAMQSGNLQIKYISIADLKNRNSEGGTSATFQETGSKQDFIQKCMSYDPDIVSFAATYREKPVVIGVDLRDATFFLTIRKKMPADYQSLECELFL